MILQVEKKIKNNNKRKKYAAKKKIQNTINLLYITERKKVFFYV